MRNVGLQDVGRLDARSPARRRTTNVAGTKGEPEKRRRDLQCAFAMCDGHPRRITMRCVTETNLAQEILIQRLGLSLPLRLRRLD